MANFIQTNNDGADQSLARKHNSSIILNLLRLEGTLSRATLAKRIGLTRSTISRIIDDLIKANLVREIELFAGKKGRPGMLLELDPKGGSAIGIEIGVNFISILLTDFTANEIWRERLSMPDDATSDEYLSKSEELAQYATSIAKSRNLRQMGIGVGVWGLVDHTKGIIRFAPNLRWKDVAVKEKWEEIFGIPVYIENDANASALGEYYFGAARNIENFLYLSMDIGIGGGIISNGKLFRGFTGYAGEIGHMIVNPGGELCSCGKRGCLETLVGRRVIINNYRARTGVGKITLEEIIQKGILGDKNAEDTFREVAESLGLGLGNLVNILNPQRIILGWSLGQAYQLLLPTLLKSIEENSLANPLEKMEIVASLNGADDCLLGCIALVLDEIIRERIIF